MSDYACPNFIVQNTSLGIVQRIASGEDFTGTAAGLSTADFVPVFDRETGIIHYKDTVDGVVLEGDRGGLFTFGHQTPIEITQVLADFGASIAWALSIVTADGFTIPVEGDTARYVHYTPPSRLLLHPGDRLKVTTAAGSAAMWLRISVRNEQAVD